MGACLIESVMSPWLAAMPEQRRERLFSVGRIRRYNGGQRIYSIGDIADGFYMIMSGGVNLISYPAPGRQILGQAMKSGSWFGEVSFMDNKPRYYDAVAVGSTKLMMISSSSWKRIAQQDSLFIGDLALLCCERVRMASENMGIFSISDSRSRLIRLLLNLSEDRERAARGIHMSQAEIADMMGITRQTVNRILRGLEAEGFLSLLYSSITVTDRRGLEALLLVHKPERV